MKKNPDTRTEIDRVEARLVALIKRRQPLLKKWRRLNGGYAKAVANRSTRWMQHYDKHIVWLHQYELGPMNDKVRTLESKIRSLQRRLTG